MVLSHVVLYEEAQILYPARFLKFNALELASKCLGVEGVSINSRNQTDIVCCMARGKRVG